MVTDAVPELKEQYIDSNARFFCTTKNSVIVLEPDYLVDVTDITECFSSKNQNPLIPIVNRFLDRGLGESAMFGSIINSLFDELIVDI